MNTLKQRLVSYGADIQGIEERFLGNEELYEKCLEGLLSEPNIDALEDAMNAGDYSRAFSHAHALKGITGNLGLTGLYTAISELVETLRGEEHGDVLARYLKVKSELLRLDGLMNGEDEAAESEAVEDMAAPAPASHRKKRRTDKVIVSTVLALGVAVALVIALFISLIHSYHETVSSEGASHLTEITAQLKLYLEENFENDLKASYSIANSVANSEKWDDEALSNFINMEYGIWEIAGVAIFTESGAVDVAGDTQGLELSPQMALSALDNGRDMQITGSAMSYTVPVDTELSYEGSRIIAVSIIQDLSGFLDDTGFSTAGGAGYLYLTQENGEVISMLTHEYAEHAENIRDILEAHELEPVFDNSLTMDDMLSEQRTVSFYAETDDGRLYIIATPIVAVDTNVRLFYFVPEASVNHAQNGFSRFVTTLSVAVTLLFSGGAALMFVIMYRSRRRSFGEQLVAREHMFDLLVQNTQTAFALFAVGNDEPVFMSNNAEAVTGGKYLALYKKDGGYYMTNTAGNNTADVITLNSMLHDWDGKSMFRSGYLQNPVNVPPLYYEVQLFPVNSEREEYVGIAQNMTQAFERESMVKDALEMAERANHAKSHFLSNMSHDIRTPMNAIVNMTDFAMESMDNRQQLSGYLSSIHESANHLLMIINDILDMSRIESGQLSVEPKPFDLAQELAHLTDIVAPLCEEKHTEFITDFSRMTVRAVQGDRIKVSRILMNLLSNAVKFTPEGGTIRFIAEEIDSLRRNIASIRFVVEDNGIGIPPETKRRVFEPFVRADDARVSQIEGTGLGLSICYNYVAAMGGVIKCESEEGVGSRFTVELFFDRTDEIPQRAQDTSPLGDSPFAGLRCLLCEDNSINRTIARTMLARLGFEVETAVDGSDGAEKFEASAPGFYDVIYMDIQMPKMDGYEATTAIRAGSHPDAKTVPIIAMTANVFAEDIEKARVTGMNGHLGKPIVAAELAQTTYSVLNKK